MHKNSNPEESESRKALKHTLGNRIILNTVLEGIPDPMFVLDGNMKIVMANNAVRKYYGASQETELPNRPCYEALMGRNTPCGSCRVQKALNQTEYMCYERKGFLDTEIREQVTICPAADPDSLRKYVSVRINDITDARKMDSELAHADRMINMGVLLSGMAHEINNPNSFIMLNAQLLEKSFKSIFPILEKYYEENGEFSIAGLSYTEMRHEIPELLDGVLKSSVRIKKIISDVKDFAGKDEVNADDSVDVNEVIQDAVRLNRKLITDTTDRFSVDLEENLPPIHGNRQAIEQVVINLIQNACQAIEGKHQSLSITSMFLQDSDTVQIEVKDRGKGISEENMNRIMDPFFTTKRETGGTGLGLSTSLNTVRNHGGTIKVDSRPKEGAAFRVFLPLSSSVSPFKVLIADDDPASRKIIRLILGKTGRFDLREAESGADALIQMGQDPPDLLILDIHMPDIDGYEVCRILRNNEALPRVNIIVITGLVNTIKAEKILELDYDKILEKPVNRDELIRTVYSVLEG